MGAALPRHAAAPDAAFPLLNVHFPPAAAAAAAAVVSLPPPRTARSDPGGVPHPLRVQQPLEGQGPPDLPGPRPPALPATGCVRCGVVLCVVCCVVWFSALPATGCVRCGVAWRDVVCVLPPFQRQGACAAVWRRVVGWRCAGCAHTHDGHTDPNPISHPLTTNHPSSLNNPPHPHPNHPSPPPNPHH